MKRTLIEQWAERAPHFRCPKCGKVSFNLNDVRQRYCGRCHLFVEDYGFGSKRGFDFRKARDEPHKPADSDPAPSTPFPLPTFSDPPAASYEAPATAPSDPPSSFDPGGGSSGGGGASGDY